MKFIKKQFALALLFAVCATGVMTSQDTEDPNYERKMQAIKESRNGTSSAKQRAGFADAGGNALYFGGATLDRTESLITNLAQSKQHVNLAEAIVSTDYKEELDGKKTATSYTIFVPNDKSFGNMPEGMFAELMEEGNEEKLKSFAGNHIVKGAFDTQKIEQEIKAGDGRGEIKTLSGMRLYFFKRGRDIVVVDERGTKAYIRIKNARTVNGYLHGIDQVLLTK